MEILEIPFLSKKGLRVATIKRSDISRDVFEIYVQGNLMADSKNLYGDINGGFNISLVDLVNNIRGKNITTILFKGGEPILQASNIVALYNELSDELRYPPNFIIESYYSREEIKEASVYNRNISKLIKVSSKVTYRNISKNDMDSKLNINKGSNTKKYISLLNKEAVIDFYRGYKDINLIY